MSRECDILVVGVGPAGGSAAAEAGRRGVRVLAVERKSIIGVPVRCAEYIPAQLLGRLDLDRAFVVQSVAGMKTFLPGGTVKEIKAPGVMINREGFDQALARKAVRSGAEVMTGTRVLNRRQGTVFLRGADKKSFTVEPRVIIGADGPFSLVAKWMGLGNRHLIPGLQVKAALKQPMEWTEVYFHPDIYGGYAWLFPKGREANVGLGIRQGSKWSRPLKATLERFVRRLAEEGKIKGVPHGLTAGWIPAEPVRKVSGDAMLLAGDAAGQTHPITGAGIVQAVLCGRLAGKWAARAILESDLRLLREYDREWQDDFGEQLNRAFHKRRKLETGWDRLAEILPSCWVGFKEYYGEP